MDLSCDYQTIKLTNLGGQLLFGGLFEGMRDFDERYFKWRIGLRKVYELINQNLFKIFENFIEAFRPILEQTWMILYYENYWITIHSPSKSTQVQALDLSLTFPEFWNFRMITFQCINHSLRVFNHWVL